MWWWCPLNNHFLKNELDLCQGFNFQETFGNFKESREPGGLNVTIPFILQKFCSLFVNGCLLQNRHSNQQEKTFHQHQELNSDSQISILLSMWPIGCWMNFLQFCWKFNSGFHPPWWKQQSFEKVCVKEVVLQMRQEVNGFCTKSESQPLVGCLHRQKPCAVWHFWCGKFWNTCWTCKKEELPQQKTPLDFSLVSLFTNWKKQSASEQGLCVKVLKQTSKQFVHHQCKTIWQVVNWTIFYALTNISNSFEKKERSQMRQTKNGVQNSHGFSSPIATGGCWLNIEFVINWNFSIVPDLAQEHANSHHVTAKSAPFNCQERTTAEERPPMKSTHWCVCLLSSQRCCKPRSIKKLTCTVWKGNHKTLLLASNPIIGEKSKALLRRGSQSAGQPNQNNGTVISTGRVEYCNGSIQMVQ